MIEFINVNENLLFDIYIDNLWYGSRRTIKQCELYLSPAKEEEIEKLQPEHFYHIKMYNIFRIFGKTWWFEVFKEIERQELKK